MVDKNLYILQLTYKIRTLEEKLKEVYIRDSKLVLENSILQSKIEELEKQLNSK